MGPEAMRELVSRGVMTRCCLVRYGVQGVRERVVGR